MVSSESRTYRLAKSAILAVLIAVAPFTGELRAQTRPAATKPAEKVDPITALFISAMEAMDKKDYDGALKLLEEVEKKLINPPAGISAAVDFKKASCHFLKKDWVKAEYLFNQFLTKYPKGTEDILEPNDNKVGVAKLTLVEIYLNQSKWPEALKLCAELRTSPSIQPKDRVAAFTLSAKIIIEQSKTGGADIRKKALEQAAELLKKAIGSGISTPEGREAGMQLVEVYIKLDLVKEAEQLKSEIDAKSSGSPTDVVRSNFQKISIGDARFDAAQNSTGEEKMALLRQALANYQGVLRRATIARSVSKAVEIKSEEVEKLEASLPNPNDEAKARIEAAKNELAEFKRIRDNFNEDKYYDALLSYRIGLSLLELKMPWEAYVAFQDIFDNSPNFDKASSAYYYYILALRDIGRNSEAQQKCKEFLKKYPDSDEVSNVALILGSISQEREEYDEAIAHYNWIKTNVKNIDETTKEDIDFRIALCYFSSVEWKKAQVAIDEFLNKYPKTIAKEQAVYMRALCWFFQGRYKETKEAFDAYQKAYPQGEFLPDVRYRQGIIKFGLNPPEIDEVKKISRDWLRDYGNESHNEAILNQIPEIHTLIGDCDARLASDLDPAIKKADEDMRTNAAPADKARFKAQKEALEKQKEVHVKNSIDAYIAAAKTARTNTNALEFVLRELGKLLPGRGENARMRDLYQEIYDWNHNDPKAMSYLYEVIKATERMGDKPEFAQRTEAVQKKFSAQLQAARKNVDDIIRAEGATNQVALDNAKKGVAMLSDQLAAELAVVEKDRQASIAAAKTEALGILSKAVAESINDRRQEGSEKLILFLAEKLARKVKRLKPGAKVDPNAYTAAKAEEELIQLLQLDQNKDSLIAQARGYFARAQLATFLRDPKTADLYFKKIYNNYRAEELSSTLVAIVGDQLLANNEMAKAEQFFQYILDHHRSSEYADYGFAGLAEVKFSQKKYKEAIDLCQEAIDNNILMSKEKELRFTMAKSLAEMRKFDEAKKIFEEIAKTKEWRGETTAGCLYWLGLMEERQGRNAEAVAYYRRCYQTWKKFSDWSAKSYLATAKILANKLAQRADAKLLIQEMLSKDKIKDTPEAAEARQLLNTL
jgi:TolA-binding protein